MWGTDAEVRQQSRLVRPPALHEVIRGFSHFLSHSDALLLGSVGRSPTQCCQMAKFDPFLSLDCAGVEGVGRNPRKGRNHILQRSVAEP